jgi:hypothetical protein
VRPPLEVVINGERGAMWEAATGTRRFPVLDLHPIRADLPGKPNVEVFRVDLDALGPELRTKIYAHLAAKFNWTPDAVRAAIAADGGLPILAEQCTVFLNHPQRWI